MLYSKISRNGLIQNSQKKMYQIWHNPKKITRPTTVDTTQPISNCCKWITQAQPDKD